MGLHAVMIPSLMAVPPFDKGKNSIKVNPMEKKAISKATGTGAATAVKAARALSVYEVLSNAIAAVFLGQEVVDTRTPPPPGIRTEFLSFWLF